MKDQKPKKKKKFNNKTQKKKGYTYLSYINNGSVAKKFTKLFLHHIFSILYYFLLFEIFYFVQLFIFFNYCLLNSIFHLLKSLFLKFSLDSLYRFLNLYILKFYNVTLFNLSSTSTIPLPS